MMKTVFAMLNVALFALAAMSAVAADDRRWKAPVPVESSDTGDATSPQIAFDAQGKALAVWQQPDGTRTRIWASRYLEDGTWGGAVSIDSASGNASAPQVAMDASGNGLAVWVQPDGTRNRIGWCRYTASDRRWVTDATLIDANTGNAGTPQVAIDANGNALAVWFQSDGTRNRIRWSRYTVSDGRWLLGVTPLDTNTGNASAPQLAFDASGNALAVWQQLDGNTTRNNIFVSRYVGSTWEAAVPLETGTGNAITPQVAFDRGGNALAAWVQFDSGRNRIFASRRTAAGVWLGAEPIETNAGEASSPKIAFDASGNALAVWDQTDGTPRKDIWSNRYMASNGLWNGAVLLEHDDAGDAISPSVVFDTNGNALAVWHQKQSDAAALGIWAARYTPGTPGSGWTAAELIERDDRGNALQPRVAFDTNGTAVAVWRQSDGARFHIVSGRYAVRQWSTPTLIETNAGKAREEPQIAVDANGNALVVWAQEDGPNTDIWANRYTAGRGWGTAELIENDNASLAVPRLAVAASGNAVAIWHQWDGSNYNVRASRYVAGRWAPSELLAANAHGPHVAFDASGNALAVWSQSDGVRANIWSIPYTDGRWGTARLIETDSTGHALRPQIVFDASGNALAVWDQQQDNGLMNIWWNRYTAGRDWATAWGTAVPIKPGNLSVDWVALAPKVAFDPSGNALAVWSQYDRTSSTIWASRYSVGRWSTPELIETIENSAYSAGSPQIAFDANGNALAVWDQDSRFKYRVWANRYTDGRWGEAELIETDKGNAMYPQIVFDASGNALAVWERVSDPDKISHIWSNLYVAGSGWGKAVQVEAMRFNFAFPPTIAIDASGNALVVWRQIGFDAESHETINVWSSRFE